MTIDLLIPVLRRPQNAQPLVDSIDANTTTPHRVTFICSEDDTDEIAAAMLTGKSIVLCPEDGYAPKINLAARASLADFVFLGADDLRFHPGWDEEAIRVHELTGMPVVGTNDLGNPTVMSGKHATHSLVHRSYLMYGTADDPAKLLHEGYAHNWVDTEFIETAIARCAFDFARDSHVEHLHPLWKKGPHDEVYELGQRRYHDDRRIFMRRRPLWRGRKP